MKGKLFRRRLFGLIVLVLLFATSFLFENPPESQVVTPLTPELSRQYFGEKTALETLETIAVKGRAPKTGYQRSQFGNGWGKIDGCSVREVILARDLDNVKNNDQCQVLSGTLNDPYTGQTINFQRGPESSKVQIDHVVALSDAWQKGAQQLTPEKRTELANDPLNLLAVDGPANQQKGDADAATWLPANKSFRCQYVARQTAVKSKYTLWMTEAEKQTIERILMSCQAKSH